jgi:hypothetical protein
MACQKIESDPNQLTHQSIDSRYCSGRSDGFTTPFTADDQQAQLYMAAFQKGLQELGWTVGGDAGQGEYDLQAT